MRLRARKARPSVAQDRCSVTYGLVSAMTYRKYGTFIAFLSVLTLVLAASETLAEGVVRGAGMAPPRPGVPTPHHYLRARGGYWPIAAGDFYGSPNDEPTLN